MQKNMTLLVAAAFLSLTPLISRTYADEPPSPHQRAQGFFALRKVVGQEKDLNKLLIIKHPRKSIKTLLKRVAEVSTNLDK
jgi:hypothetical protein